jgi:hypothetical protein
MDRPAEIGTAANGEIPALTDGAITPGVSLGTLRGDEMTEMIH